MVTLHLSCLWSHRRPQLWRHHMERCLWLGVENLSVRRFNRDQFQISHAALLQNITSHSLRSLPFDSPSLEGKYSEHRLAEFVCGTESWRHRVAEGLVRSMVAGRAELSRSLFVARSTDVIGMRHWGDFCVNAQKWREKSSTFRQMSKEREQEVFEENMSERGSLQFGGERSNESSKEREELLRAERERAALKRPCPLGRVETNRRSQSRRDSDNRRRNQREAIFAARRNGYLHNRGWADPENRGLHHEEWAQEEMAAFHRFEESLRHYHCVVCKEAWPLSASREALYTFSRCKRDKKPCRLYSAENDMDPGSVPAELQGLSEVDELLIARAFPIMSIYRKHGVNADTRDTFSISLRTFRVFWIASRPAWMTYQYWWSESKVQVSFSKRRGKYPPLHLISLTLLNRKKFLGNITFTSLSLSILQYFSHCIHTVCWAENSKWTVNDIRGMIWLEFCSRKVRWENIFIRYSCWLLCIKIYSHSVSRETKKCSKHELKTRSSAWRKRRHTTDTKYNCKYRLLQFQHYIQYHQLQLYLHLCLQRVIRENDCLVYCLHV